MTVGASSEEGNTEGPGSFYVCLQNLPFGTCQKQVSDFFANLHVPLGAVSIHRSCAFVAFDNQVNVQLAVAMDQRIFGGKVVMISKADRRDVLKTQVYDVRRRLSVDNWTMATNRQKRIRPTLLKDRVDEKIASKAFCPEEIDFPVEVSGTFLEDWTVSGKETKLCLLGVKVPEMNNQPCMADGNVPQRRNESCLKIAGEIQESYVSSEIVRNSLFQDGMENQSLKRIPLKKKIKPTPAYVLSQFNLHY